MDTQVFHTQQTVEEVLKTWPQTLWVFRRHGTDCVGCLLQRFCTLEDVSETYEVGLQDLIKDLEECVKENNHSQRSIP
jgi:hybrid cluster-associated redox disulfide protein